MNYNLYPISISLYFIWGQGESGFTSNHYFLHCIILL